MIYKLTTQGNWTHVANYKAGDARDIVIVRAASEDEARQVAAEGAFDEGEEAWQHESTTVEPVDPDGPSGESCEW